MHFFSGQHSDYHKPSDDSDKINAEGGARILQVVAETARAMADRADRPTYQIAAHATSKEDQSPNDLPRYSVVMGVAPSYGDDGKPGMAIDAVTPEGPAAIAGMKAGDRILRINAKSIANIHDYMASTRGNNPGDTVEVEVLRGDVTIHLKVTLSGTK